MPRLLALLAVGAACAAALDLENEARHELYDDALDEAEPLLAPDHAAEAAAEALAADQAAPTLSLKEVLVKLGVDPAAIPATLEDLVDGRRHGRGLRARVALRVAAPAPGAGDPLPRRLEGC